MLRRKALDEFDKFPSFGALENVVVYISFQRFVEGHFGRLRHFAKKSHPPLPHIPAGAIDHTREGKVILIGDHPQVRERVFDLHSAEKLHAAVDGIGDLPPEQHFLHRAADVVGAVQHRHVPERHAPVVQFLHLQGHPLGFLLCVPRVMTEHRFCSPSSII